MARVGTVSFEGLIVVVLAALTLASPALAQSEARKLAPELVPHLPPPWGLSRDERRLLSEGSSVRRPVAFTRGDGRYVGGVAYQTVHARPEAVLAALGDAESLAQALPRTKSASVVAQARGVRHIELVQGNAVVEARYTVRVEAAREKELRFRLDRDRPHDIQDVWGFFRVESFGEHQSLLTVAVALDLGPGMARMLFERRVQAVILDAPRHIRDHVEAPAPSPTASLTLR